MKQVPVRRHIAALVTAAVAVSLTAIPSGPAAAQPGGFGDVPEDAYFAMPVTELNARGVFAGTECDDGFCPSAPIDRKTMAVWTVRVIDGEDPPPITESRFDDVDAAGFHAPFIERMAQLGVTGGCGDGSGFCPNRNVTRAQMAAFLSRAYKLPDGPDPGFDDVPAGEWYAAYVARLAASRITVGCRDGTVFCPGRDTTRGEMATFLHRAESRGEPASFSIEEGPRGNDTLISASRGQTCAVRLDGGVACWGQNGLRERYATAGLRNVVAISAADDFEFARHTCVLHEDQTVSCWGAGRDGQLGQGDTSNHYLPVKVPGITDAVAVSAGRFHTCAVHRDGGVSCWGHNLGGALGDGTEAPSYFPKRVAGLSDVVAIAAAQYSNCVIHRDGDLSCWGWPAFDSTPTRFEGPEAMASVSMSSLRICTVSVGGAAYCWPLGWPVESATRVENLADVVEVAVGYEDSCALHRDGGVSCWGRSNDAGQIGDGTTTPRLRPVRLDGIADAVAVSVSVGSTNIGNNAGTVGSHACALHENGSASCWGGNEMGQLGDGTTDNRLVPTRVRRVETIPTDQIPTTHTGLLRAWSEAAVQEYEADYPWLRVAWDSVRDQTWAVQSGFGGQVFRDCFASADSFGCKVQEVHITEFSLGGIVHEMLHVYDLHTGLAPSAAWGAVQLYFATTHPECWTRSPLGAEILADTVTHLMVHGAWLTYYNSPGCPTVPERSKPTPEAVKVVLEGLAGQVPEWYRENITNGAELWAAWLRGPSLPALANLAGEFGGLCSTDWITYPLNPDLFPPAGGNPFRDGGCEAA